MSGGEGRLAGKCAVVTGGASGIGRAAAERFAGESARVVIADRAGAEEAAAEIEGAEGVSVDVTSEDDVARMAEVAGRVDVLYANAGIEGGGSALDVGREQWERVIAINLTGVWLSIRAVLPGMLDHGGGSIITQSSTAGLVGVPGLAAYSAAKGGVIALTRQVAVEYGKQGIRANAICPGTVWTPLVARTLTERGLDEAEAMAGATRGYPLRRLGTVEEIAAFALFLASDESAWITGGAFAADGGYTAR